MRRTKKILLLFLCGIMLFLNVSCGRRRTDVKDGEGYIYAVNNDRTGIVKISYEFPEGSTEETARAVLGELARPSEKMEYLPAIPESVRVQKCEIENAIANVDLSQEYLQLQTLDEILCRSAAVQSLLQVEGISGVRFSVDGERLKNSQGKLIGLMTADDFVQNSGSSPSSYQTDTLTLYFANETGDRLVEEKETVKYNSNIPKEKLIVEKLMSGPQKSGSYPVLNPDATLLSITIQEGICYVNFDPEFLNSAYDVVPEIGIYALVDSLIEGTAAEMVQIMVNGERNVLYQQKVDLSQPLQYDGAWIQAVEGTAADMAEDTEGTETEGSSSQDLEKEAAEGNAVQEDTE